MDRQIPGIVSVLCIAEVDGTFLAVVQHAGTTGVELFDISEDIFDFLQFIGVVVCPVMPFPPTTPTPTPVPTPTIMPTLLPTILPTIPTTFFQR